MARRASLWAVIALFGVGCLAEPMAPVGLSEGPAIVWGPAVSTGLPSNGLVELSAFEPFVIADGAGRILVADGFGRFATSIDGGATFVPTPGPAPPASGRITPGGDVALVADARDRIWFARTLQTQGSEGRGIHIATSPDGGVTWEGGRIIEPGGADRPWWAIEGTDAHLAWTDVDDSRQWTVRSEDNGATFSTPLEIVVGGSGSLAIGADGPLLADCVGGSLRLASPSRPATRAGELPCQDRPMLAHASSRIAVAYVDLDDRACLATSEDGGRTWDGPGICEPGRLWRGGEHDPHLWVIAQAGGSSMAYFVREEGGSDLHVVRIRGREVSRGVVVRGLDAAGDYPANTDFPTLTALPDGRLVAAWAPASGDVRVSVER